MTCESMSENSEERIPGASIETTNGNHLRLRLPDGQSAIAASTPGDRRFLAKVRAEVRRRTNAKNAGLIK